MYTNWPPRQQQQRQGQPAQPANPYAQLLHFLPILLLIAFTFMSTQSEPVRFLDCPTSPAQCHVPQVANASVVETLPHDRWWTVA